MDHVQYIAEAFKDSDLAGWTTPGWYFWDEASGCHGPYDNEQEARTELAEYCKVCLGG
jgi:hypothetical protein